MSPSRLEKVAESYLVVPGVVVPGDELKFNRGMGLGLFI